jgi:signal transduction histidine kinase
MPGAQDGYTAPHNVEDRRMLWTSWVLALIAFAAVAYLFMRLHDERATTQRLRNERMHLADEIEQLQATRERLLQAQPMQVAGRMAAVVADEIDAPLGATRDRVRGIGGQLDAYRQLVKNYDAAVQYCLQPVEMIFGADKSALDQLVKHVEEARRQLFSARRELEKSPLLTDSKSILLEAARELDRSATLVGGLHTLTRADAAGTEPVDINASLDAVLALITPIWGERIAVEREYSDLPAVACMLAQICSAFLHILDNAAKAIEGRGTVSVQTRAGGTRNVEIRIGDTGVGIEEHVLPEIFEPFFSTRADALGLGLSNAQALIKAHGGSINVRTTPGSGTTILISLPIHASGSLRTAASR